MTPNKPKPTTRAKTSKRFVLRVTVEAKIPLTRASVRAWMQAGIDNEITLVLDPIIKSARVTNADIP